MTSEIRVPTLGESISEATVGNWYKKVGEAVEADETLCDLDTDKVAIEVRAQTAGTLKEIVAAKGADVKVDALLAVISEGKSETSSDTPEAKEQVQPVDGQELRTEANGSRATQDAPSARRLMDVEEVEPGQIQGSGRDGRVMKPDVVKFLEAPVALGAAKSESGQPPGPMSSSPELEERIPMTRLRQTIANRLKSAQNTAAILTTYNEVDMTNVMQLRSEYKEVFTHKFGIKLGFMSFFVKACCNALLEVPEVNGEIDGTDLVFRQYVNMGIAVGTPTGLVVPVVRHAQALSFAEIEQTIADLGVKAKDGKLTLDDMQGGTFSISNGGVYGSLMSSPILNPPQSGILGMHKIQERPVAIDGQVVIRPMMYLALSYDHRIVDGKGAVTFLVRVKEAIEDPRRLLLEI